MFVIVGRDDSPIYEANVGTVKQQREGYLTQFVMHSALDIVDEISNTNTPMHLKVVDKFNELLVSAYVTSANIRFILVHEGKNEDSIANFFKETHELYIRAMLNPFYDLKPEITNATFDTRVKNLAKKYLG